MLAGVAGGIADRFDVDVSLVRVAFVVLACAWGTGALVYLAMWALVPSAPRGPGDVDQLDETAEPTPSWLAFLLLAGVLCFGLLVVTSWWGGPRWGGGLGLLWVVLLFGLLVVALRDRSGRRTLRRAVGIVVLGCMTLAIVVAGSFLGLVASTGVPMSGGIGERIYQPTSLAQVQRFYRTSIGDMTVDLRQVRFPASTVHVTASVAVGHLTVEVPPGVLVDVSAHAGVGNVSSSPGDLQSFSTPALGAPGRADREHVLVLVAEVGVGRVDLVRSEPS
jgi:phage shock protein PspC (stress-responsive transcriptional regulator)